MLNNSWPAMEWRGPLVTQAEVTTFEEKLGHSLPRDYRGFLLDVNGGNLAAEYKYELSLFRLNAIDERDDLLTHALFEREVGLRPSLDLLSIGYDYGAPLMIAVVGERRGEVWLERTWDSRPDGSNPRVLWHDRRDMKKLGDSFEQFMSSLKPLHAP